MDVNGAIAAFGKVVETLEKLQKENAELKRLLKLAVEDLHYFAMDDFEPCFKCEICEKTATSGHRCKDVSMCNFHWYKLKECEQICAGDKHWKYIEERTD